MEISREGRDIEVRALYIEEIRMRDLRVEI